MDEADGSYLDEFSQGLCGDLSAESGGGGYALDGDMAEEQMTNASSRVMDALGRALIVLYFILKRSSLIWIDTAISIAGFIDPYFMCPDKILREQVNLELEEFQTSLHNLMTRQVNLELEGFQTSLHKLLTRQHAHHQQLLTHSQTPANQVPCIQWLSLLL